MTKGVRHLGGRQLGWCAAVGSCLQLLHSSSERSLSGLTGVWFEETAYLSAISTGHQPFVHGIDPGIDPGIDLGSPHAGHVCEGRGNMCSPSPVHPPGGDSVHLQQLGTMFRTSTETPSLASLGQHPWRVSQDGTVNVGGKSSQYLAD